MDAPKLLRVSEVAKVFNVSRPTVYRMVKSGGLESYTIAGSVRIPAEAVQQYLAVNHLGANDETQTAEPAPEKARGTKAKPRGAYVSSKATAEMLAERKAWQIARRMAVKLVPADATDAQWDEALRKAYAAARKRIQPAPAGSG